MKVYIVTHGEYSDYRIIGAFIDKDEAERFKWTYGYDEVEEYDTLDHNLDKGMMFKVRYYDWLKDNRYCVSLENNPDLCDNNVFSKIDRWEDTGEYCYYLYLYAKNEKSALKIAHERMGAILAMGDALKVGYYTFPDYKEYKI